MAEFSVSQSKIKCWQECRKKYHYRFILNLHRRKKPQPLVRGLIIHKMIEYHIEGKDPMLALKESEKEYNKMFKEEQEYYGDIIGDIKRLMTAYFSWFRNEPLKWLKSKKTGKRAEHVFKLELVKGIVFQGTIDAVADSGDDRTWLADHKSHKQLPEGDFKYSDIQGVIYTRTLPELGFPRADGVVWNYIRAKPPTIPDLLKSGEMSRRANIDTTWPVYKQALITNGLDPKDYKDMQEILAGREGSFFHRVYLPVHKTLMNNVFAEVVETAREMKQKAGSVSTRSIDRHCQWCEYYPLCQAELRGLDAKIIRRKDYVVEEDRYEIKVQEEE